MPTYPYESPFSSDGPGLSLGWEVVDRAGAPLVPPLDSTSQPAAATITDQGDGFYLFYTEMMPYGTRGLVRILEGSTVIAVAEVSPEITEPGGSGSPHLPGTAKVYGYSLGNDSLPSNGRVVTLTLVNPPQFSGSYTLDTGPESVTSGPDGYWFFVRPSGGTALWRIVINEEGIDKKFLWPGTDTNIENVVVVP